MAISLFLHWVWDYMYDTRVVDIPLFLIRRGRGGGGNYLDMTSWTFVWAKNSFVWHQLEIFSSLEWSSFTVLYWVHKIIVMILWKNTDMSCYKRDKSAILRTYHFDLLRQIEVCLLELESKSSFSEILPVYMFLAIHTRTLIQDLCCK